MRILEPMTQAKVVLLLCGSFNPPTHMHLRLFELARDYLNGTGRYQVVGGVMSPVHDHYRKQDLVSSSHRCALTRLALQDNDWVHLSDWECQQSTWLPTLQVIQYHENKLNSSAVDGPCEQVVLNENESQWVVHARQKAGNNYKSIQVKLLCGADLLESFGAPNLWNENDIEKIVGNHGLVAVTREGSNPYKFIYESDILSKFQHNITIVTEWIGNDISSTKIRRSLRRGESVKYLISNQVIEYIKNKGLYTTSFENNKYRVKFTPSPNDIIMTPIDVPDSSLSNSLGSPSTYKSGKVSKRARPGHAVAIRNKVQTCRGGGGSQEDEEDDEEEEENYDGEEEEETRVEIQIAEDGSETCMPAVKRLLLYVGCDRQHENPSNF